jgi:hypothetical protein
MLSGSTASGIYKEVVSTTTLTRHDFLFSLLYQPIDIVVAETGGDHQAAGFLPRFRQPVVWLDYHGDPAVFSNAKPLERISNLPGCSFEQFDFFFGHQPGLRLSAMESRPTRPYGQICGHGIGRTPVGKEADSRA